MNVVFVSPAGSVLSNLNESGLDPHTGKSAVVLTWNDVAVEDTRVRVIAVGRAPGKARRRLMSVLAKTAVGRNALRLSPLDGGRRMWRAIRRDPLATAALANADLIVAAERDAILSVWTAVRSVARPECAAVYGMPAGRAIITGLILD